MVFRQKMCSNFFFYGKNNFGIAHFYYCDWCLKIHFKAIIFFHTAFVHKIKVLLKNFIREISNMPLLLYLSHICALNAVLEKISQNIFFKLTYTFTWRSHFPSNITMLYIDEKLMPRETFWRILFRNRWRNVEVIVIFLNILGIIKLTKTPPRP